MNLNRLENWVGKIMVRQFLFGWDYVKFNKHCLCLSVPDKVTVYRNRDSCVPIMLILWMQAYCTGVLRCHLESLTISDRWGIEPKHGQIWKDLLLESSRKLQRVNGTAETKSQANQFSIQYFSVGLLVYVFVFWRCVERKGGEKEGWKNVFLFRVTILHPYLHVWDHILFPIFQPTF